MRSDRPPRRGFDYGAEPPSAETAERLLRPATDLVLGARERNEALAALDLDSELATLAHEWLLYRGLRVHLERHEAGPDAPTVIVAPGLGDHARRHLALAAALREHGFSSLLVDRVGHGISEGRRGDATLEADLGLLELTIAVARASSSGPVILLGDSLGGIMTWCLLTREPDIDAAVCHCIGHPDVPPTPAVERAAPAIRLLGRVLPLLPIGVERIADYEQVALDPETRRYFEQRSDPLFNFTVTARAVASYLGFEPGIRWTAVRTPALVVIGESDRMVSPEYTRRVLEHERPPHAEYLEIPDAGHQLFLDHIGDSIGPLVDWLKGAVAASVAESA